MSTKNFPLRVLLTVTTGRLLTKSSNAGGNGISDLYDILGHMTGESPFTHQLPRFGDECRPWLLKWFPELGLVGDDELEKLDAQLKKAKDSWSVAEKEKLASVVEDWLAWLQRWLPQLQPTYAVGQINDGQHISKHPLTDLADMMAKSPRKKKVVVAVL